MDNDFQVVLFLRTFYTLIERNLFYSVFLFLIINYVIFN